ncbi:MAG: beta-phosphoglucomutase [Bacteroidota bacterium]
MKKSDFNAQLNCFIFDLDGVIVDTAKYHFIAWKFIAKNLGVNFSREHNESLKGISRKDSLDYLLSLGNIELSQPEKNELLHLKNEKYLEFIRKMDKSEILPGVLNLLTELKNKNKQIALGSASKNAPLILEILELKYFFSVIVDGNAVKKSKPDPEVFQKAADFFRAQPFETVVFEDSIAGIEAANRAGFFSIGVGDKEVLKEANIVFEDFQNLNLSLINSYLSPK